jgi:hypothetical protein
VWLRVSSSPDLVLIIEQQPSPVSPVSPGRAGTSVCGNLPSMVATQPSMVATHRWPSPFYLAAQHRGKLVLPLLTGLQQYINLPSLHPMLPRRY